MRLPGTCGSIRRSTRRFGAAVVGCCAALHSAGSVLARSFDLVGDPPRVESVAVQFVDPPSSKARLYVTYAPDERLDHVVRLNLGDQTAELRDDGEKGDDKAGDHIYTGAVSLDINDLRAQIGALGSFETKSLPVFDGLELVDHRTLARLTLDNFKAAVQHHDKIVLEKFGACAVQPIDWKKSLLIADTSVMHDPARTYDRCAGAGQQGTPTGQWSFPYLIRELAGGSTASPATVSNFIRNWLNQWSSATSVSVNGWPVPKRQKIEDLIITPWRTASVGTGMEFDPAKAPFRLLAIVNRIDKSDALIYGRSGAPNPGSGGELRFVFGAMSPPPACAPLHFTVIVEFGVNAKDCVGVTAWAKDWIALSPLGFGPSYNQKLAALTDQVVPYGRAPWRPNKSLLDQVRTNENSLEDAQAGATWDMREFHLNDQNQLVLAPVENTPDGSLNESTALQGYINANATAIKHDRYEVPLDYPTGTHFLGGHIFAKPALTHWKASGITDNDARFHFSLNTCNGCHADETGTASTHIKPSLAPGSAGQLSAFLTGGNSATVPDPVVPSTTHTFADLDRRTQDLAAAATLNCVCHLYRVSIPVPH